MFDIINFIFWILIIFDTHGRFDKHLDHPLVQIYCKNQAVSMGYLYPWQKSEGNYIGVIRLAFCELRKNPHVEYHEPNRFIIEDSENNQFFKLMQFNASFRCEMMKLAEKYGQQDISEIPLIFTRILQNTTLDWFRRQKTQNTWVSLFSALKGSNKDSGDESEYSDPLEFIESKEENLGFEDGSSILERKQLIEIMETEISKLPARQREAFLMRYWDDLGISETAKLMACSEGSVKTHCSRAAASLAKALKKQGFKL